MRKNSEPVLREQSIFRVRGLTGMIVSGQNKTEENRRLKTGFKEKLAAVVEEKEAEAITAKVKTKQKVAAVEEKGAQSLVVSKKKAASV